MKRAEEKLGAAVLGTKRVVAGPVVFLVGASLEGVWYVGGTDSAAMGVALAVFGVPWVLAGTWLTYRGFRYFLVVGGLVHPSSNGRLGSATETDDRPGW